MKFRAKFEHVNTGHVGVEEHDIDTKDPVAWCREIAEWFNSTLRPGESPRKFIEGSVEVLNEHEHHDWVKMTSGQSVQVAGGIADLFYCRKCHITGKRFGISRDIKPDSKYKAKAFKYCDTARKLLRKRREQEDRDH